MISTVTNVITTCIVNEIRILTNVIAMLGLYLSLILQ